MPNSCVIGPPYIAKPFACLSNPLALWYITGEPDWPFLVLASIKNAGNCSPFISISKSGALATVPVDHIAYLPSLGLTLYPKGYPIINTFSVTIGE